MNQFDVYQVDLNPGKGAEMKKTRPAVVISPDEMNRSLKKVIIAPLTHTLKNYPSRVPNYFRSQSAQVVLDQMRSVDKARLKQKQGIIDALTAARIKAVLAAMFF
jgi:mRNA interferase MazF